MSFKNIVGNTKIKQELKNVANSNAVSHSYLFVGEEGIGKKQIAREFAKMILCLSQEKEKCNQCDSCIKFISNNNQRATRKNISKTDCVIKKSCNNR